MATTPKQPVDRDDKQDPAADTKPMPPEHDPGHGRWILDPVTGKKRNNNEGA
ncbi:hypothetical protein [Methylomonas koyamae]|uniref:hypothetical protein n=1 Tax=Methylomonas koyamae TaxID=702114 RepID=UPI000A5FA12A|nr:hypothetical protein [Methylomonas koyamae]